MQRGLLQVKRRHYNKRTVALKKTGHAAVLNSDYTGGTEFCSQGILLSQDRRRVKNLYDVVQVDYEAENL